MAGEDNEQKITAVIYGRYSSGSGQTDQSLEGQLRDCYAYAKKHNMTVIQEYLDRHISGKDAENRQAFQRMIADSKKKKFTVVLVWKLDRFSRNRYDSARYKAALKRNNVKVISVMEPIAEGPEGIILESVLEGFAEYFSAELSQKVKRGMLESAHKCKCVSRPPLGYKIGPEREYIIDEEKAPYIRRIFEMYVQGERHQKIVDEVNAMGCRTSLGNPLGTSIIAKIIQCEKYVGVYESQGVRVEDAIPPIVPKELWHAAQKRLKATANGSYTFKNHGACAKQNYLLSGKVFCGECGASMIGETTLRRCPDGSKERRSYYTCSKRKCNSRLDRQTPKELRCYKKLVRKEELETLVKLRTRFFLKQPEVLNAIRDECKKIEQNQQSRQAEVKAIKSQQKSVEKKINNILAAIEEGVYATSVSERLKDLEAQQFQLKQKLDLRDAPTEMSEQMKWFLSVYVPSDTDTDDYWKDVFALFLDSVVCFNNGKVVITFNLFDDDPSLHGNRYKISRQVEDVICAEYTDYRVSNSKVHQTSGRTSGGFFCDFTRLSRKNPSERFNPSEGFFHFSAACAPRFRSDASSANPHRSAAVISPTKRPTCAGASFP